MAAVKQELNHERPVVLVVDDDAGVLKFITRVVGLSNQAFSASCVREAEAILATQPVRAIVCDHHLAGEEGLSFLTRVSSTHPAVARILITGDVQTDLLLDAINRGHLFRFLVKPVSAGDLTRTVEEALLHNTRQHTELLHAQRRPSLATIPKLVGLALVGLVLMLVAILALGIAVFLVLYFFKSALGIDLLPNAHLSDFL